MIVGLGHQAQVGKDTAGLILTERHGYRRLAFADILKAVAYDSNPTIHTWDLQTLVDTAGWEGAKRHREVREFLQNLGVAARDHIGEDVWVNAVVQQIDPYGS